MQDVYVETEVMTLPLRFAMVASRVVAALRGLQQQRSLDQRGRRSLEAAADLLESAAKGGKVLADQSMAEYSAEAMSAYRLIEETAVPGKHSQTPIEIVGLLKNIANGLRSLAKDPDATPPLPFDDLDRFFIGLTKRSLEESAGPVEEVVRLG